MKKILLITAILIIHICAFSQNYEPIDPDKKTDWWGDIDGFLNQQAKITLGLVDEALKLYPPALSEPLERKMALLMIDNVLHEEKAAQYTAIQEFIRQRIKNAVDEVRNEEVKEGAVIWKIYNHTFIVKTPSVTIGFDIQRGIPSIDGFTFSKELIQQLIDAVDVLFVSHFHRDHADAWVAETFLAQNKPVVSPEGIFSELSIYPKIIHPERKAHEIQEIVLPAKKAKLKIVVYSGHQGKNILNNVYLVFTPEGLSFSQTGDQSNDEDFEWIDKVSDFHKVDVLMPNCWTTNPSRLAKGFRPGLVITGHENEMGHTIDHREPFWLNSVRWGDIPSPRIQMTWGEKFHYLPDHLK
jgi:L-ascorbate metabolism protein UlaG (beta-lactamase superfamily)